MDGAYIARRCPTGTFATRSHCDAQCRHRRHIIIDANIHAVAACAQFHVQCKCVTIIKRYHSFQFLLQNIIFRFLLWCLFYFLHCTLAVDNTNIRRTPRMLLLVFTNEQDCCVCVCEVYRRAHSLAGYCDPTPNWITLLSYFRI